MSGSSASRGSGCRPRSGSPGPSPDGIPADVRSDPGGGASPGPSARQARRNARAARNGAATRVHKAPTVRTRATERSAPKMPMKRTLLPRWAGLGPGRIRGRVEGQEAPQSRQE
ncbi:hypothetical protein Maq22A_1p38415 (plasmid) [Methylobacterium aquaticum]|uniref:Uncharacterized protein n=1 Tax=Methylobacterium aquaticum TaxID=270351 RepID=A0A1Y0ZCE3_9HYPH|nr:hypothetical protein Maq22A_1p38415 [Methylobacterium aquaticum]